MNQSFTQAQYELTWEVISTADEDGDIGSSRINGVRNWIKGKQQPLTWKNGIDGLQHYH